ncbi:translation initiation factor IF-2-like [Eublepharis macularius]|uniref:Translation initiation factor IF-2-like n=1 Tax=Eublepharis macularius TaxID=481883 RepID=A0AA97KGS9_EUBMA|nr:translation initiation factor IF-2-like [Eublepharis macularius]
MGAQAPAPPPSPGPKGLSQLRGLQTQGQLRSRPRDRRELGPAPGARPSPPPRGVVKTKQQTGPAGPLLRLARGQLAPTSRPAASRAPPREWAVRLPRPAASVRGPGGRQDGATPPGLTWPLGGRAPPGSPCASARRGAPGGAARGRPAAAPAPPGRARPAPPAASCPQQRRRRRGAPAAARREDRRRGGGGACLGLARLPSARRQWAPGPASPAANRQPTGRRTGRGSGRSAGAVGWALSSGRGPPRRGAGAALHGPLQAACRPEGPAPRWRGNRSARSPIPPPAAQPEPAEGPGLNPRHSQRRTGTACGGDPGEGSQAQKKPRKKRAKGLPGADITGTHYNKEMHRKRPPVYPLFAVAASRPESLGVFQRCSPLPWA